MLWNAHLPLGRENRWTAWDNLSIDGNTPWLESKVSIAPGGMKGLETHSTAVDHELSKHGVRSIQKSLHIDRPKTFKRVLRLVTSNCIHKGIVVSLVCRWWECRNGCGGTRL